MPKEKNGQKKSTKSKGDIQRIVLKFPEEDKKVVKYYLIEPFAYVDIQWDEPQNLRIECLQIPLQISVYLSDAGGDLLSSADFILTLTQPR